MFQCRKLFVTVHGMMYTPHEKIRSYLLMQKSLTLSIKTFVAICKLSIGNLFVAMHGIISAAHEHLQVGTPQNPVALLNVSLQ